MGEKYVGEPRKGVVVQVAMSIGFTRDDGEAEEKEFRFVGRAVRTFEGDITIQEAQSKLQDYMYNCVSQVDKETGKIIKEETITEPDKEESEDAG